MKSSVIKNYLAAFLILFSFGAYAADVAGILPQGKTQFLDSNGKPLTSGKVFFKIPGTDTLKTTWQDAAETTPNLNPVILDAAGRAIIWGFGSYRQQVFDRNNNLIWDQVTASAGSGSGGGGSTVGDGNLVGTVLPWTGLIAPPNYVFAYGQEIARLTYPEYLAAVTSIQSVFCTSGSPILSVADTTQLPIGAAVEVSCAAAGATIVSKTTNSVNISVNANTSTNVLATFYPWGNGNGTTTFNVPDYRGRVIAGRDNMGGVAASRLTTTYFGSTASSIGGTGGNESHSVAVTQGLATAGTVPFNNLTPIIVPTVQPTITANYIVKITPDVSSSVATGVASISGMTGILVCGTGLTCSSGTISATPPSSTLTNVGTGWGLTGGPCITTCTVSVNTINPAFQFGNSINAQLNATVGASALTIALKANDGTDGTSTNPILIPFRNVSLSNGSPTWLALTASLSLTVPSTATLGTANTTPFRIWIAAVNDAGTIRLCVINTLSGVNIFPLAGKGILTSLGTPANATQTFYCGSVVTAKAYTTLGYITYESGLATAGTWSSIPDVIQLYGAGVPLPGAVIQDAFSTTGSLLSGSTTFPPDNTIPQTTEGNLFMTQAITPVSAANILDVEVIGNVYTATSNLVGAAIFNTVYHATNALASNFAFNAVTGGADSTLGTVRILRYKNLALTTSASTFTYRAGSNSGTIYLNGNTTALYGGTIASTFLIKEIQR